MVFSLASAAVVCRHDSGQYFRLGTLTLTTARRYLKLLTLSNFSQLILMFLLIPFALLVITLVFSALISMPKTAEVYIQAIHRGG